MRTTSRLIGLGLATVLLAACGKQDTPAADAPAPAKEKATSALASNAPVEAAPLRGTPDFGVLPIPSASRATWVVPPKSGVPRRGAASTGALLASALRPRSRN